MVRFQNKCFSPELTRSAATENLPRRLRKGSGRRSRTAAGTEHPKISPWFAVKTCISDAACCSQIIPHCPTPTQPHLPKGEQAWTGRDEYQLNGIRYLNCFSLLTALHASLQLVRQRCPWVEIKNSRHKRCSRRSSGTRKSQPERRNGAGLLASISVHSTALLHDSKLFIHSASKSLFTYLWNSCRSARNFSWVNLVWDAWKSCYWNVKGIFKYIFIYFFIIFFYY